MKDFVDFLTELTGNQEPGKCTAGFLYTGYIEYMLDKAKPIVSYTRKRKVGQKVKMD